LITLEIHNSLLPHCPRVENRRPSIRTYLSEYPGPPKGLNPGVCELLDDEGVEEVEEEEVEEEEVEEVEEMEPELAPAGAGIRRINRG